MKLTEGVTRATRSRTEAEPERRSSPASIGARMRSLQKKDKTENGTDDAVESQPTAKKASVRSATSESASETRDRVRSDQSVAQLRARLQSDVTDTGFEPIPPPVEPEHGTGTADVQANTEVRTEPDAEAASSGQIEGEVTVTGQTARPDEDGEIWYQVEYEVEGQTQTGWVPASDVDETDIDWRNDEPIQLFDANGVWLSSEDAADYQTAAAAQQELEEEYGVEVRIPDGEPANGQAPDFRPITPEDAEVLEQTLQQVRELEGEGGYGVDLQNRPNNGETIAWAPNEIAAVHEAVTGAGQAAYDRAVEQGYEVDSPQQVFKDVYICGAPSCTENIVIERVNSSTIGPNEFYAINRGGNVIGLAHSTFYSAGEVRATPGSFGPDFTPTELIAHELGHEVRGEINPDYAETGTYVLQSDHEITYTNEEGETVTEVIEAGTEVELNARDDGYAFGARSSNTEVEVETDAATAYTIERGYSLGFDYSRDENLEALARQEQGDAIFDAVLVDVYGAPPPPPPAPGRRGFLP